MSAISFPTVQEVKAQITELKRQNRWEPYSNTIANTVRDAILSRRHDIVQLYLEEGADADGRAYVNGNEGYITPLISFAARIRDLPMVKLLVGKGAKIKDDFRDESRSHAGMRAAIESDSPEIVEYLLEQGGSAEGLFGEWRPVSFLGRAAFQGSSAIVRLLVQHGADVGNALERNWSRFKYRFDNYENYIAREFRGKEPQKLNEKQAKILQERNQYLADYIRGVKLLLDHAQGVDLGEEQESYLGGYCGGLSVLRSIDVSRFNFVGVSMEGKPITREMLIKNGIKGAQNAIYTVDQIRQLPDGPRKKILLAQLEKSYSKLGKWVIDGIVNLVPLPTVVEKGDTDVVIFRLCAGGNPNQMTNSYPQKSALVRAAELGHEEIVKALATHPLIDPKSITSAAAVAKEKKFISIAEFLSELQDLNQLDEGGNAPIHNAVRKGNVDEVKRLIEKRVNLSLENEARLTPLDLAIEPFNLRNTGKSEFGPEYLEILELLLAAGVDSKQSNGLFYTSPLHRAIAAENLAATKILLPLADRKDHIDRDDWDENESASPWYTPLIHSAFERRNWKEFFELFKACCKINFDVVVNPNSKTLLQKVGGTYRADKLDYLLKNGADPSNRISEGFH